MRKKRAANELRPQKESAKVRVNGSELRRLRKERALTQRQLAANSGVGLRKIVDLENDDCPTALPKAVLDPLARCLGVPVQQLLHEQVTSPSHRFELDLKLRGTLNTPHQARLIFQLTSEVINHLVNAGIQIDDVASQSVLIEKSRIFVPVSGELRSGDPCWLFFTVKPSSLDQFFETFIKGTTDFSDLEEYGEFVGIVLGETVPQDTIEKIAASFFVTPQEVMQAINDAPNEFPLVYGRARCYGDQSQITIALPDLQSSRPLDDGRRQLRD